MEILGVRQPAHLPNNMNQDLAMMGSGISLERKASPEKIQLFRSVFPTEILFSGLVFSPSLDPSTPMPKDVVLFASSHQDTTF